MRRLGFASRASAAPVYLTCKVVQGSDAAITHYLGAEFPVTVDEDSGTMLIGEHFDGGHAAFTADMIRMGGFSRDSEGFLYELSRVTLKLDITDHTPSMGTTPAFDTVTQAQCAIAPTANRTI